MSNKSPSKQRKEAKRKALKARHKEMRQDRAKERLSKYALKCKRRDKGQYSPGSPFGA